jgi:hypothetical protein
MFSGGARHEPRTESSVEPRSGEKVIAQGIGLDFQADTLGHPDGSFEP